MRAVKGFSCPLITDSFLWVQLQTVTMEKDRIGETRMMKGTEKRNGCNIKWSASKYPSP